MQGNPTCDAGTLRQRLVPVLRSLMRRRLLWATAIALLVIVFSGSAVQRVLTTSTTALMVVAMLLLWPLRLRQRVSPLTDDDAVQLLQTAALPDNVTRNRVLAIGIFLVAVVCALIWLPPLAGALAGLALGIALVLWRWVSAADDAGEIERLNPLIRDLALTRPELLLGAVTET
jgi:uncharacterized membrane protein